MKDFVKHGKESGFVEITLYDDHAPKHPIIRRTLNATSNSSEWTINRKSALEKDVRYEEDEWHFNAMFLSFDCVVV